MPEHHSTARLQNLADPPKAIEIDENFDLRNRLTQIEAPQSEEEAVSLLRSLAFQRQQVSNQLELLKKLDGFKPETFLSKEKQEFVEKFKARAPFRDGDRFHKNLIINLFEDPSSDAPLPAIMVGIFGTGFSWALFVPKVFESCAHMPPVVQFGAAALATIGTAFVSFCSILTTRWLIRTGEDIVTSIYDLVTTPFKMIKARSLDKSLGIDNIVKDLEVISEAKEICDKDKQKLISQMILAKQKQIEYLDQTIHTLATAAPNNDVETFGAVVARGLEVKNPILTSDQNLVEAIFETKDVLPICEKIIKQLTSSKDEILSGVFTPSDTGNQRVNAALNSRLMQIVNSSGVSRIEKLKELHQEITGLQNAYKEVGDTAIN
jgi:hypothetical protein